MLSCFFVLFREPYGQSTEDCEDNIDVLFEDWSAPQIYGASWLLACVLT